MVTRRDFLDKHCKKEKEGEDRTEPWKTPPCRVWERKGEVKQAEKGGRREVQENQERTVTCKVKRKEGWAATRGHQVIQASPLVLYMDAWLLLPGPIFPTHSRSPCYFSASVLQSSVSLPRELQSPQPVMDLPTSSASLYFLPGTQDLQVYQATCSSLSRGFRPLSLGTRSSLQFADVSSTAVPN